MKSDNEGYSIEQTRPANPSCRSSVKQEDDRLERVFGLARRSSEVWLVMWRGVIINHFESFLWHPHPHASRVSFLRDVLPLKFENMT